MYFVIRRGVHNLDEFVSYDKLKFYTSETLMMIYTNDVHNKQKWNKLVSYGAHNI